MNGNMKVRKEEKLLEEKPGGTTPIDWPRNGVKRVRGDGQFGGGGRTGLWKFESALDCEEKGERRKG